LNDYILVGTGLQTNVMQVTNKFYFEMPDFNDDAHKNMIVMWAGAIRDIPLGWLLCDGTHGTPDLRSKFIIGTDNENELFVDSTGGSNEKTLTVNELPKHSASSDVDNGEGVYLYSLTHTNPDASWKHLKPQYHHLIMDGTTPISGQSFDNRPSYYSLAFIMKSDKNSEPPKQTRTPIRTHTTFGAQREPILQGGEQFNNHRNIFIDQLMARMMPHNQPAQLGAQAYPQSQYGYGRNYGR
jgi:hypothetical protein